MHSQSFKEMLATSGPDRLKSPMLSREERLAKSMPPVVVEMLEQRRLMALTVDLESGILTVTGTSGADSISASLNTTDNSIYVTDGSTNYGPYSPSSITAYIKILAGAGNDTIKIDRGASTSVPESCQLYGEGGDDSMEGGLLADTLYGGDGVDKMYGFDGDDSLYGGAGYDEIYGGEDNDNLRGEDGNDYEYGGNGNDFVYGGNGYDSLYGDDGNDTMGGDADDDFLIGGNGADNMAGGIGDDWFHAGPDQAVDTVDGNAGTDSIGTRKDTGFVVDVLLNMEA